MTREASKGKRAERAKRAAGSDAEIVKREGDRKAKNRRGRQSCFLIAGSASGVGKTSISIGICAALQKQNYRIQPFKVGPDYLDPTWLTSAAGRQCYNLDSWMTDSSYIKELFAEKGADADVILIEGVMGLFDGASATGLKGSSAEIAKLLGAGVVLVVDAGGMARSIAALVEGFLRFEEGLHIAAVIANNCGSESHARLLEDSLQAASLPPLAGWLKRETLPQLPSRHLGLQPAQSASRALIEELAAHCASGLDLKQLLQDTQAIISPLDQDEEQAREQDSSQASDQASEQSSEQASDQNSEQASEQSRGVGGRQDEGRSGYEWQKSAGKGRGIFSKAGERRIRLGIAQDRAIFFYYPDNLELLKEAGAEMVQFSPLEDRRLPVDLDALYLGGGYPELYARQLSENRGLLEEISELSRSRRVIYAECGGLLLLSRLLIDLEGQRWPMGAVLPFSVRMLPRFRRLGYMQARLQFDCILGRAGTELRGHEFHYSEIIEEESAREEEDFPPAYSVYGRRQRGRRPEGYCKDNLLASYIHLHFASNRSATPALVEAAREAAGKQD